MFAEAWKNARIYLLATIIKNIFMALTPLLNIAGIGLVVDALISDKKIDDILTIIIVYVGAKSHHIACRPSPIIMGKLCYAKIK